MLQCPGEIRILPGQDVQRNERKRILVRFEQVDASISVCLDDKAAAVELKSNHCAFARVRPDMRSNAILASRVAGFRGSVLRLEVVDKHSHLGDLVGRERYSPNTRNGP
jgi:hypothetical protein